MPEQRVTGEMVLEGALAIVRREGEGALSARTVAHEVGCSVQPVYSLFGSVDGLVQALYQYARTWTADFHRRHADKGPNAFASNGLSHMRLAREERNLFHFLYLSPHMDAHSLEDVYTSVALPNVEQCIQDLGGLTAVQAHDLYLNLIIFTHGLSVMLATGADLSEEELQTHVMTAFNGFLAEVSRL